MIDRSPAALAEMAAAAAAAINRQGKYVFGLF